MRVAVNGRRRRKDDILTVVVAHDFNERDKPADIAIIIFYRLLYRFAHGLKPRKVYNGVYLVFSKDLAENYLIPYIAFIKLKVLARDLFYTFQRLRFTVRKIIDNDRIVSGVQ